MITFEIVDEMPSKPRSEPSEPRRVIVHGSGAYLSGYIRCSCGRKSPESIDPLAPYRWLAGHTHG